MNTWYQMWGKTYQCQISWGKTYQCQISNAGGWFIGVTFLSSMTFPWLLMIFQSSMTFHDFSRKFYFSRFSRPCIGLGLFNDDTHPSGHISRPTQVNVSQELLSFSEKPSYTGKCVSELLSFSKQLLKSDHIVHVWGLVEVNKLHHIR